MINLLLLIMCSSGVPAWISNPPEDGIYYYGFSWSNIEDEEEEKAFAKAREKAILNLASKIKIRVVGTIQSVLKVEDKGMSEVQSSTFDENIKTYVDISLSKVEIYKKYKDPKYKRVGVMVRMNMADYQRNLRKEMEQKKGKVLGYIKEGQKREEERNCTLALKNYLLAFTRLKQLFQEMPIYEDMDSDGTDEELNPYIYSRIDKLLNRIKLLTVEEKLVYSVTGSLGKNLKVKILCDWNGISTPCKNFPLKDSVVFGEANISRKATSLESGMTEFRTGEINPKYDKVILRVKPDLYALLGEEAELPKFVLPYTEVVLLKKKSVGLSVCFDNAGTSVNIPSLYLELKSYLLEKEYGVVKKLIEGELKENDFNRLSGEGLDFFLSVKIRASSNKMEENLYVSYANAEVSLYSVGTQEVINTKSISSSKTFGGSSYESGMRAYLKIKGRIIEVVKTFGL